MMNILITGASGFVGQATCQRILTQYSEKFHLYPVYRSPRPLPNEFINSSQYHPIIVSHLEDLNQNSDLLGQIDCIVHLAARVHQMNDRSTDPLSEFRRINCDLPYELAQAAVSHGVKRFIYLSSIKVNGEETHSGCVYRPSDVPNPQDPYGVSKWEAEVKLTQLAKQTGLEVVILRPPLVYGPQVKANFLQMMRFVDRGIPLPLGAINNQRSLVYVENLADAIIQCALHPSSANQTFLVSDRQPLSTPQLLQTVAQALQVPSRLLPIPSSWLQALGKLTGKSKAISRLTGSLVIDSSHLHETLNWIPPYSTSQGISVTAKWFKT